MTFDQFANQGDTAAWDPEAAAATKRASEKIFRSNKSDDSAGADGSDGDSVGTDGDEDAPKHDPNQPGEVPDPDLTLDP